MKHLQLNYIVVKRIVKDELVLALKSLVAAITLVVIGALVGVSMAALL